MKTDQEKLQELIELAWDNGFRSKDYRQDLCSRKSIYTNEDLTTIFSNKMPGGISEWSCEEIIFDQNFIKALCASRWGNQVNNPIDSQNHNLVGIPNIKDDLAWFRVITNAAIAPNRIDYLYGVFYED